MRAHLFLISLALSSAACSDGAEYAERAGVAERPTATATATASTPASEAQAVEFEDNADDNGDTRAFAYSWPAAASAIPALAEQLQAERDEQLGEQKDEWQSALADSPVDCVSCRNRGFEKKWLVVADLPDWLSLSADLYVYTGGPHGTYGKSSLVWDKSAGRGMAGIELFNSPVDLEQALGAKLCAALTEARAKRRGGPVEQDGEWPNDCPGLDEASILVGSSNEKTFDRIAVYFGPYVAGPYAEGDYELDFPVTASVIDAVKPEYARAFSVKR